MITYSCQNVQRKKRALEDNCFNEKNPSEKRPGAEYDTGNQEHSPPPGVGSPTPSP